MSRTALGGLISVMSHSHHEHGHEHEDTAGVHGRLPFGGEQLYLSHLPVLGPPHSFPVILEVTLESRDGDPRQRYLEHLHVADDEIFTFEPEEFPIAKINPNTPAARPPRLPGRSAAVTSSTTS